MASIRKKGRSSFIGSTWARAKEIKKRVPSKRQGGKMVDVVEHRASVNLSNGNFMTMKIVKAKDEQYKKDGISYFVECAEFESNNSNDSR